MSFKDNLKRQMNVAGLNQRQLAKLSGVPTTTLNGWLKSESKSRGVNLEQLKNVADALEISVDELAYGPPHKKPKSVSEVESVEELQNLFSGDIRVEIKRILRTNKQGNK